MPSPSPPPPKRSSTKGSASIPPIGPNTFYGTRTTTTTTTTSSRTRTPPPLPERPQKVGSTHTTYIPPEESGATSAGWREPELVEDTSSRPSSSAANLVQVDDVGWNKPAYPGAATNIGVGDTWDNAWPDTYNAQDAAAWAAQGSDSNNAGWGDLAPLGSSSSSAASRVRIDGRDEREEDRWWDVDVRTAARRPGAGVLPPLLAEMLGLDERVLYALEVGAPENIKGEGVSADALAGVIPHPRAYFAPSAHGWIVIQTFTGDDELKLAEEDASRLPLASRRAPRSCTDAGPGGNATHHFHRVEHALSPSALSPPLRRPLWKPSSGQRSPKRRRTSPPAEGEGASDTSKEDDVAEVEKLDIWACCQCMTSVAVSELIPSEVPRAIVDEFSRDKFENPTAGKSGEETLVVAWETLVRIIENRLWKGETRSLPLSNSGFARRVGWNETVQQITDAFGFHVKPLDGGGDALWPRIPDFGVPGGKEEEARLVRVWVEVSAWLADYCRKNTRKLEPRSQKLCVTLNSQTEDIQLALGAHVSQIPRGTGPEALRSLELRQPIKDLGLTPTCASYDLIAYAYLAQNRCDPAETPTHFSSFWHIINHLYSSSEIPNEEIQTLLMDERSRGRFDVEQAHRAAAALGFGEEGELRVDYVPDDTEDEFLVSAWRDALRRSWKLVGRDGDNRRREVSEAFRILAQVRGSKHMIELWEKNERSSRVPPERAWEMLGISRDVDEGTIIAAFCMQVQDNPSQMDRMKEALITIAEVNNSARLGKFLECGLDPGDIVEPTRPDLPRGLNQLGNTCYLNSLLQYFYTIKDLREAVMSLARAEGKALENNKLTEDDLKRHRVGGRLVTKREILRSKRFVSLLAALFDQMETTDNPSITPAVELAKLALVTSQDEDEEDVLGSGGSRTDGSNDTDATLVDDAITSGRPQAASPTPLSPGSVLGKRGRGTGATREDAMDVDEPTDYVFVSAPPSPVPVAASSSSVASSSKVAAGEKDADGDVEMMTPETAKPVVKRKATVGAGESVMMFGRQHDVSECMDNCMFQIETALLRFDEMAGSEDKTSVVKGLFYGKLRQRITAVNSPSRTSRSSIHEKEDPFSHLPLNVSDEGYDLYDGLSGYFDDTVEFEGKPARMEVALVDLPPVLQIQLQRVQFDRETMTPYKSQAYVKFGDTICMDRFLDRTDKKKKAQSKAIQQDLNACRERIQALTKGKHAPYGPALTNTVKYLEHLGTLDLTKPDQGTLDVLAGEEKIVDDELYALRGRAARLKTQLEDVWRDSNEAVYELTSVFIHRGSSPSWGHYFFYSRHLPENPDAWFKYNDSEVTEVSKEEVFADTTGSTANPYLLVYARKGAEIVDTVKRLDTSQLVEAAH